MATKNTGNGYGPRQNRPTMADTFRTDPDEPAKKSAAAKKKVNSSIWIDPDLRKALRICAAANDTTISELLEEGARMVLDKHQTSQP